jgi:hypothetical protein
MRDMINANKISVGKPQQRERFGDLAKIGE